MKRVSVEAIDLFDRAMELPAIERESFVRRSGAQPEVRDGALRLLAQAEHVIEADISDQIPAHEGPILSAGELLLDRYIVEYAIDAGGFGEVYSAIESGDVRRRVAVKLFKLDAKSTEALDRFREERRILASMNHPSIPKLFGSGVTSDGRPFFVMEFIDGEAVTAYCDRLGLNIGDRLEIFLDVCAAIHHAHGVGVIHRDIKPSNVLVSVPESSVIRGADLIRGVVHVIDFGIAATMDPNRLYSGERTIGGVVGSWTYMSPEQADRSELGVDHRSDVYSLGMLLYELVTCEPPYEWETEPFDERRRIISDEDPMPPAERLRARLTSTPDQFRRHTGMEPSEAAAILDNELGAIIQRAIRKQRSERWQTVSGFATAIRRYQDEIRQPSQKLGEKRIATVPLVAMSIAAIAVIGVLFWIGSGQYFGSQSNGAASARYSQLLRDTGIDPNALTTGSFAPSVATNWSAVSPTFCVTAEEQLIAFIAGLGLEWTVGDRPWRLMTLNASVSRFEAPIDKDDLFATGSVQIRINPLLSGLSSAPEVGPFEFDLNLQDEIIQAEKSRVTQAIDNFSASGDASASGMYRLTFGPVRAIRALYFVHEGGHENRVEFATGDQIMFVDAINDADYITEHSRLNKAIGEQLAAAPGNAEIAVWAEFVDGTTTERRAVQQTTHDWTAMEGAWGLPGSLVSDSTRQGQIDLSGLRSEIDQIESVLVSDPSREIWRPLLLGGQGSGVPESEGVLGHVFVAEGYTAQVPPTWKSAIIRVQRRDRAETVEITVPLPEHDGLVVELSGQEKEAPPLFALISERYGPWCEFIFAQRPAGGITILYAFNDQPAELLQKGRISLPKGDTLNSAVTFQFMDKGKAIVGAYRYDLSPLRNAIQSRYWTESDSVTGNMLRLTRLQWWNSPNEFGIDVKNRPNSDYPITVISLQGLKDNRAWLGVSEVLIRCEPSGEEFIITNPMCQEAVIDSLHPGRRAPRRDPYKQIPNMSTGVEAIFRLHDGSEYGPVSLDLADRG